MPMETKPSEKYLLTIEEAAAYFGIGQKKLRKLAEEHSHADFVLKNGANTKIKRKKFEQFLDRTDSI